MSRTRALVTAIILAVLALVSVPAEAVGTVVLTSLDIGGGVTRYKLVWTSDGSGNVSGNAFSMKVGELLQIKFVPNGGGTAPTALYDVALTDTDTVDLMAGLGTDLSATASTVKVPLFGSSTVIRYFHDGQQQVDLVIANAGASKGGIVYLWVR